MSDISTLAKSSGRRMTAFGVIALILGIAAMATPIVAGLSVVVMVGLLVTVGGVLRMFWAFGTEKFGNGLLAFAAGCLTLLCGLTLVASPLLGSAILTILISLWLFMDGVSAIVAALPRLASKGVWLLLEGIVSVILAGLIWRQFPLSGSLAIGIFLGVKLLFVGVAMIMDGAAAKTLAHDLGKVGSRGA